MKSLAVVILMLSTGIVRAETGSASGTPGRCQIWGQVVASDYGEDEISKIELMGSKSSVHQTVPIVNGNFQFEPAPPGMYRFRVFDSSNHVSGQWTQRISGNHERFVFRLQNSHGTISRTRAGHKIPAKASALFEDAIKMQEPEKSIEYLQKALAIDPEFQDAEVALAREYAGIHSLEDGLAHARRAFAIDPHFAPAASLLVLLLLDLTRYDEAESAARGILDIEPDIPEVHAALAVSLVEQNRKPEEAQAQLQTAAAKFPFTRLMGARAFLDAGKLEEAAAQVREYLGTSAHECEREELEHWWRTVDPLTSSLGD